MAFAVPKESADIHSRASQESGVDTGTGFVQLRIQMGDGTFIYFHRKNNETDFTSRNKLHSLTRQGEDWLLIDQENDVRYLFSYKGLLKEQVLRNEWRYTYGYDLKNRLTTVETNFGRGLGFYYGADEKLIRVASSDQREILYDYHPFGGLSTVHQVDGTTIKYVYTPKTTLIPPLLAGVFDENNTRYTKYTYDSEGWAIATERAAGTYRYQVPVKNMTINPLLTSRTHGFVVHSNRLIYTGTSPAAATPDAFRS